MVLVAWRRMEIAASWPGHGWRTSAQPAPPTLAAWAAPVGETITSHQLSLLLSSDTTFAVIVITH